MTPYGQRSRIQDIWGQPQPQESMGMPPRKRMDIQRAPTSFEDEPDQVEVKTDAERYYDEMMKVRGNAPLTARYKQHLSQTPTSDQYKPSGWRKTGAAVMGALAGFRDPSAGMELAGNIVEAPYRNAMRDYTNKGNALGMGAEFEQEDIKNRVGAMSEANKMGLSYAQFRQKSEHDDRLAATGEFNANTNRQRANAYLELVNKPEWDKTPVNGGVMFTNKKNPRESFTVPGETIASLNAQTQKGFLGVAQGNLGVARSNADNARDRTGIMRDAANHDRTMDLENVRLRDRQVATGEQNADTNANRRTGSPTLDRSRAYNQALTEMAADPEIAEMIDNTAQPPRLRDDLSEEDFAEAEELLEAKIAQILGEEQ